MRHRLRTLLFGVLSGLVWSIIPIWFLALYRTSDDLWSAILAGTATGIAVSFLFRYFVAKCEWPGTWVLGIITLPVGAFLFGIFQTVVLSIANQMPGKVVVSEYLPAASAITFGGELAALSLLSSLSLLLIPLAMGTTLLLRYLTVPRNTPPDNRPTIIL